MAAQAPPAPPPVVAPLAAVNPLQPISGVDGYITMLLGASTSTPHATGTYTAITQMPGGSYAFPANQLYEVTDRTKKIGDPSAGITVWDGAAQLAPSLYRWLPGGNYILFYTPRTGTPAIAADFSSIDTAAAGAQYGL